MTSTSTSGASLDEIVARVRAAESHIGIRRSSSIVRGDHDLNPDMVAPPPLTQAAVLVPIVAHPDQLTVLLTRRTAHLHDHAGQIAFPGGRVEAGGRRPCRRRLARGGRRGRLAARADAGRRPARHLSDAHRIRDRRRSWPSCGRRSPCGPIRSRSPRRSRCRWASSSTRPITAATAACSRAPSAISGRCRSATYYIWGATAGMLVNLSEVLRREM